MSCIFMNDIITTDQWIRYFAVSTFIKQKKFGWERLIYFKPVLMCTGKFQSKTITSYYFCRYLSRHKSMFVNILHS